MRNDPTDSAEPGRRLLVVATIAPTISGFLLPFAEHFKKLGWRVDAAAAEIVGDTKSEDAFDNVFEVGWTREPTDLLQARRAAAELRDIVSSERYDLVHFHTPIASFAGRFAVRKMRRRREVAVVYTAHGFHFHEHGSARRNRVFMQAEKLAARWTDELVTINQYDFDMAVRNEFLPADRISLIPGIGIDMEEWDPERIAGSDVDQVRKSLGVGTDESLILMIASHDPEKRHDLAIKAFAAAGLTHTHLAFAGTGPLMEQNRELAESLGVIDRVHFLGSRSDIPVLIRASTTTLTTSTREGMSRSTMESMALAVPVIGSRIRGVRDLLGDDECGVVVEAEDISGFARGMRRLVEHPDVAARMGAAGRRSIEEYELGTVLARYEQVYEKAMELGAAG